MNDNTLFKAPWGKSLKWVTALCVLILIGIPIMGFFSGPSDSSLWILIRIVIPLSIFIIASFFTIRGYLFSGDTLFIQRLGWQSKLNLRNLISAEIDPEAMSHSIRTWGNG